MSRMLTFGSLFSGIGGFDLGFERAGMRCLWQVEIDNYATRVLERHWPDVARFRDVRECGGHNLAAVDVVCGGFPCQPHSLAGKRRGAADDRDLWPEMRRVVQELHPTWVVGENVPGIVSTILDAVLADLEVLGYETQTLGLPAAAFGAYHRRERIFILAHANDAERGTDGAQPRTPQRDTGAAWDGEPGRADDVADAERQCVGTGLCQDGEAGQWGRRSGNCGGEDGSNSKLLALDNDEQRQEKSNPNITWSGRWPAEPNVGRVAYGVPHRVDRLRCLGNAIVPQVAEFVGRLIVAAETHHE